MSGTNPFNTAALGLRFSDLPDSSATVELRPTVVELNHGDNDPSTVSLTVSRSKPKRFSVEYFDTSLAPGASLPRNMSLEDLQMAVNLAARASSPVPSLRRTASPSPEAPPAVRVAVFTEISHGQDPEAVAEPAAASSTQGAQGAQGREEVQSRPQKETEEEEEVLYERRFSVEYYRLPEVRRMSLEVRTDSPGARRLSLELRRAVAASALGAANVEHALQKMNMERTAGAEETFLAPPPTPLHPSLDLSDDDGEWVRRMRRRNASPARGMFAAAAAGDLVPVLTPLDHHPEDDSSTEAGSPQTSTEGPTSPPRPPPSPAAGIRPELSFSTGISPMFSALLDPLFARSTDDPDAGPRSPLQPARLPHPPAFMRLAGPGDQLAVAQPRSPSLAADMRLPPPPASAPSLLAFRRVPAPEPAAEAPPDPWPERRGERRPRSKRSSSEHQPSDDAGSGVALPRGMQRAASATFDVEGPAAEAAGAKPRRRKSSTRAPLHHPRLGRPGLPSVSSSPALNAGGLLPLEGAGPLLHPQISRVLGEELGLAPIRPDAAAPAARRKRQGRPLLTPWDGLPAGTVPLIPLEPRSADEAGPSSAALPAAAPAGRPPAQFFSVLLDRGSPSPVEPCPPPAAARAPTAAPAVAPPTFVFRGSAGPAGPGPAGPEGAERRRSSSGREGGGGPRGESHTEATADELLAAAASMAARIMGRGPPAPHAQPPAPLDPAPSP